MTEPTKAKSRVLVVEDEALIAMLMEDMLADLGCEVLTTVGQIDEALAVARSESFDFAFVDVNLNGVPSYPVAAALKERDIPFAFVTGYGAGGTDPAHGDVAVLQKPFRAQDLETIVRRLRSR